MASIRSRDGKWQARVIRKGQRPVSRTFAVKSDAVRWARSVELELDQGTYTNTNLAERTTFQELIQRYIKEVLSSSIHQEDKYRLNALGRHWIGKLSMLALTPSQLGKYRDERLGKVSSGTLIREFSYISSIINHARREWGINVDNPVPRVKKPSTPLGRSRILSDDELQRLFNELKPRVKDSNVWVLPLVMFAYETAMRRGEILGLKSSDINYENQTAFLPITKNGTSRTVPLSLKAIDILRNTPPSSTEYIFPIKGPNLSKRFEEARARAKLIDFHFHDLRHMAITRIATKVPNLIELSAVSGHKSLAMLKRYYHPNPKDIAKKLG